MLNMFKLAVEVAAESSSSSDDARDGKKEEKCVRADYCCMLIVLLDMLRELPDYCYFEVTNIILK